MPDAELDAKLQSALAALQRVEAVADRLEVDADDDYVSPDEREALLHAAERIRNALSPKGRN